MKLQNKKTGDIVPASNVAVGIGKDGKWYDSLADLNKDWEDAPEDTKDFWYIRCGGAVKQNEDSSLEKHHIDKHKEIGNYFSTREEAEKAVEKLKAWKRLKDKGFKFKGYTDDSGDLFSCQVIRCSFDYSGNYTESRKDLDLLFEGEE